jgi:hypothetical protein
MRTRVHQGGAEKWRLLWQTPILQQGKRPHVKKTPAKEAAIKLNDCMVKL